MDKGGLHPWLESCDLNRYPPGFIKEYEPFECLANSECAETLLVKNKRTGMFYIAKCYLNDPAVSHTAEADILKKLQHTGLPRFVDEYQSETMLCVIREYVEGTPLHQWAAEQKPDSKSAVRIALQLCELLHYLHSQTPPIIHRDIKPQNLIVGTDGQLWLIDFGISRLYQEEGIKDTACFGTQDFASPEQYGFAQTDVRSDLYSLGVVLGWLLTGETKREDAIPKITDKRLLKIVNKCTAFAPGDRYASSAKLRADLLALDGRRRRKTLVRISAAAIVVLCLVAGFAIGRYTQWFLPPPAGVQFQEPLIGQAARLMLGLEADAMVTPQELLSVQSLFICGDTAAADSQRYQELIDTTAVKTTYRNGGIATLDDLLLMPNLMSVNLSIQNIGDLSPLKALENLQNLDLRHNPIKDLSPMQGHMRLQSVCLFDTLVSDLSALASCPQLTEIDAGGSRVTSVEALRGDTTLRSLRLFKAPLETLQGMETLQGLIRFEASIVADGDLGPLLQLDTLQTVTLGQELKPLAEKTLQDAAFAIVYRQE